MNGEVNRGSQTVSASSIAGTITPANSPTVLTPLVSGRRLGRGRGVRKGDVVSHDRTDARPGSPEQLNSSRRAARDTGAQPVGLDGCEVSDRIVDDGGKKFAAGNKLTDSEYSPAVPVRHSDYECDSVWATEAEVESFDEAACGSDQRYIKVGKKRWEVLDAVSVTSHEAEDVISASDVETVYKRSACQGRGEKSRTSAADICRMADTKLDWCNIDEPGAVGEGLQILSRRLEKTSRCDLRNGRPTSLLRQQRQQVENDDRNKVGAPHQVIEMVNPCSERAVRSAPGIRADHRFTCSGPPVRHQETVKVRQYLVSPDDRCTNDVLNYESMKWDGRDGYRSVQRKLDRHSCRSSSDSDDRHTPKWHRSRRRVQSSDSSDEDDCFEPAVRETMMQRPSINAGRRAKLPDAMGSERRLLSDGRTESRRRVVNRSQDNDRNIRGLTSAKHSLQGRKHHDRNTIIDRYENSRCHAESGEIRRSHKSSSYRDNDGCHMRPKRSSHLDDIDEMTDDEGSLQATPYGSGEDECRPKSCRRTKSDLKPLKYDGTTSIDTFLIQFETCADYNDWGSKEKAAQLKCCLSGAVGQILWEAGDPGRLSYKELVSKLKARYGSAGQKELFVTQLRSRRRRANETLAELYRDIKRLMALAYPNTSGSELHEEIAKSHFIASLGDREFQLKLQEKEAKDLDALFTTAVRLEAYQSSYQEGEQKDNRLQRGRHNDGLANRVATIERKIKSNDNVESRCNELERMLEKERGEKERVSRELDRLKYLDEQRRARESMQPGMTRQEAKLERPNHAENSEHRNRKVKCYKCHEFGHYARDCKCTIAKSTDYQPTNANEDPTHLVANSEMDDQTAPGQVCGAESGATTREAFLRLKILGRRIDCLLDTGSEVTLLPAKLVGSLPVQPSSQKLLAANGTVINVLGQVSLEAEGGRHTFSIMGFVSDQVVEVILGIDFLRSQKAVWCFEKAEITLNGHKHRLSSKKPVMWSRRVVAASHVTVPGRSECLIPSYVVFSGTPKQTEDFIDGWVTERNGTIEGLHVSRVLIPDRSVDVPVRVLNVDKEDIVISSGTVLADLQPAVRAERLDASSDTLVEKVRQDIIDELVRHADTEVSESLRSQLRVLLDEYKTVFSTGEMDLGRTGVVQHEIDTGLARPIRQPLRRHPPAHQVAIQEHVSSMLKQGVIEPAQSPWASNIVLVRKKDGSLRCCVDYRQLNKVTRKDAYPLPRTDTCLDAMCGAQWFSTFDLRSSYHQVEVRPQDADKTAFICREGLFRFVTMPFGLCGAPATFQRLMDMVMSGLNFESCLVYLDDIIVFSDTTEKHLERLALVLDRIRSSGLKIKASKTHLLRRSVDFLGHVISCRGVEPQLEKVSAVVDWPRPESVKDIKAFLGLCGYYRRFIESFAEIAAPLYELLRKGRSFEWNERCDVSFERLKTTLTSAPILGVPNDNDSFVLDTDASDESIGAVLSQIQNGREVVIAFASRRLSQAERNYCITRRELLAVVSFVKYFRHYLLGRTFTVRTDHAALRWLKSVPEPIGQQARWLEQLEEYNFSIEHRAGSRHGNADAMSRRPCDKSRCCRPASTEPLNGTAGTLDNSQKCFSITAEDTPGNDEWSAEIVAKEQENDPEIGPILTRMKQTTVKPLWDDIASLSEASKSLWQQWDRLKIFRNILVRRFETVDGRLECLQTILPVSRRLDFIRLVHEGPSGGHLGRRRTERQVQLRAYWPGWTTDVRRALAECVPCARYHRGKAPRQTPLKPFVAGEPWEVISVDITGPHPRSRRGYVFILTLVDHFTKWAEALPIRNHTATTIARVLFDHVFSRFGMPVRCLTDQGAEFESVLFSQLCQLMGIHKIRTTPYRPSTNGVVERFHRTLNSMLAKVVSQNQKDWCEHLPGVMSAYRASLHETTHFSPNKLMFGRENRLPVDIVMGGLIDRVPTQSLEDFVEEMTNRQKEDFDIVRSQLAQAALRRKERYDDKVNEQKFQAGQLVWYFHPRKRQGLSPKWQSWYVGPYRVVRLIDSHNVVIQKSRESKSFVVHRDKLKACFSNLPQNSASQPTASADLSGHCSVNLQPEDADIGVQHEPKLARKRATPSFELGSERPKRLTRLPNYMSDFVVSSVFRLQMASQMVYHARTMGLVCDVCSKAFAQRHGLKYHLESKVDDPHHAEYARRELKSWGSRGQYRTAERRHVHSSFSTHSSHSREGSVDTGSNSVRQQLSSNVEGCWNERSLDRSEYCLVRREQVSPVPRVRSVVRATTNSNASFDRPRQGCQRPFPRRFYNVSRHNFSTARRRAASAGEFDFGPARTLYVGAMRLARQTLRDSSQVEPEKAIKLTQHVCPRMSTGQARVAAAAVFAGIHATMQALFPPSGSPMSSETVKKWQQAAGVVCERMKIRMTDDSICSRLPPDAVSQSKSGDNDLQDETVAVSVDFGDVESGGRSVPEEHQLQNGITLMVAPAADVLHGTDDSGSPSTMLPDHVETACEAGSGVQQLQETEIQPEGRVPESNVADDNTSSFKDSLFPKECPITVDNSPKEPPTGSSPLRTRSYGDTCSRAGTPPFWSAVDGKMSSAVHSRGRCLHVEMPVPTARPCEGTVKSLDERIRETVSDPASAIFWAVQAVADDNASEETSRAASTNEGTKSYATPTDAGSEMAIADNSQSVSARKRPRSHDDSGLPTKLSADKAFARSASVVSKGAKSQLHSQKEKPTEISYKDNCNPLAVSTKLNAIKDNQKSRIITTDQSAFGTALLSGTTSTNKKSNKDLHDHSAVQKKRPQEPKSIKEQERTAKSNNSDRSKTTPKPVKATSRAGASSQRTTDKENRSTSIKKKTKSSETVTHTSEQQLDLPKKSSGSTTVTTAVSSCSATVVAASVSEPSSGAGTLESATSASATITPAVSIGPNQPGVVDPYAWACMFGAMAAGMNFFHGQPPRWPSGIANQAGQPTMQSAVGEQVNPPSTPSASFWPSFPGFGFPFPRWQAP